MSTVTKLARMPPLYRFDRALEKFREHDPAASTILLQVFTTIAINEPFSLTRKRLADIVGVAQASMTHNLDRLGPETKLGPRLGGKGLGLVEDRPHREDGRMNVVGLTAKGRNLADVMARLLGEQ